MENLLQGCDAVVSCLGHNLTLKGMFREPRTLVSDTVRRICGIAAGKADAKVKLVLMSTTAYTNPKAGEKNGTGERIILSVLKLLLPPHRDHVLAADHLNGLSASGDDGLEWVAIRPDTLVDDAGASAYELHEAPVRSPMFDAGKTSRANVARFMADLVVSEETWQEWKYKMPVIYDATRGKEGAAHE